MNEHAAQICACERPFLPKRECGVRVRAFGGAVEPSMTQEGNSPILKQAVDEKKSECPRVDGLGVVERRGEGAVGGPGQPLSFRITPPAVSDLPHPPAARVASAIFFFF